jgi:hypothetical protein
VRRLAPRLALVVAQWLGLTAALAASVIYAAPSVDGLVAPRVDGSWPFVVAFLAALLLGIVITRWQALVAALALMLLAAAATFSALVMTPAWDGTVVRTRALENFAINQLVVLPLVLLLPAAFGALSGSLLRGLLDRRNELLPPAAGDAQERRAWFDVRRDR